MDLPAPIAKLVAPLFEALPLDQAMPELIPKPSHSIPAHDAVAKIVSDPLIKANPALEAALWLYVDDLSRSHEVSQNIHSSTGSAWHGIMHRREGDFSNSKYWFRQAGRHPALIDPSGLTDQVAEKHLANPPELLVLQRQEWAALFEWSAKETKL